MNDAVTNHTLPTMASTGPQDSIMDDIRPNDLAILFIGITGAGKSTFINNLLGRNIAPVGHSTDACTDTIQGYPFILPSNDRIILVDTPGFDHPRFRDSDIVKRIESWLSHFSQAGGQLAGIVCLYDMTASRQYPYATTFISRHGPVASKNKALVTTKWNDVVLSVGEMREELYKKGPWQQLLANGAVVHRDGTISSDIVNYFLGQQPHYTFGQTPQDPDPASSLRNSYYGARMASAWRRIKKHVRT